MYVYTHQALTSPASACATPNKAFVCTITQMPEAWCHAECIQVNFQTIRSSQISLARYDHQRLHNPPVMNLIPIPLYCVSADQARGWRPQEKQCKPKCTATLVLVGIVENWPRGHTGTQPKSERFSAPTFNDSNPWQSCFELISHRLHGLDADQGQAWGLERANRCVRHRQACERLRDCLGIRRPTKTNRQRNRTFWGAWRAFARATRTPTPPRLEHTSRPSKERPSEGRAQEYVAERVASPETVLAAGIHKPGRKRGEHILLLKQSCRNE